jgi:hypothetical protein
MDQTSSDGKRDMSASMKSANRKDIDFEQVVRHRAAMSIYRIAVLMFVPLAVLSAVLGFVSHSNADVKLWIIGVWCGVYLLELAVHFLFIRKHRARKEYELREAVFYRDPQIREVQATKAAQQIPMFSGTYGQILSGAMDYQVNVLIVLCGYGIPVMILTMPWIAVSFERVAAGQLPVFVALFILAASGVVAWLWYRLVYVRIIRWMLRRNIDPESVNSATVTPALARFNMRYTVRVPFPTKSLSLAITKFGFGSIWRIIWTLALIAVSAYALIMIGEMLASSDNTVPAMELIVVGFFIFFVGFITLWILCASIYGWVNYDKLLQSDARIVRSPNQWHE